MDAKESYNTLHGKKQPSKPSKYTNPSFRLKRADRKNQRTHISLAKKRNETKKVSLRKSNATRNQKTAFSREGLDEGKPDTKREKGVPKKPMQ